MGEEKEVNNQEPKSAGVTADEFLDNLDAEAAAKETPSPDNAAPEEDAANETDSDNNGEAVLEPGKKLPETIPYSRFQSVIKQKQEAEAKIKELEGSSSVYAKLLDDPAVYKKYLQVQGYRTEVIQQMMAERGFGEERPAPGTNSGAQLAEEICKELGWDFNRLNADQKAYLQDQVQLVEKVTDRRLNAILDKRLGPTERYIQQNESVIQTTKEMDAVKEQAKTEFPDLDFKTEIEPLMSKALDAIEANDPKGLKQVDANILYERATRQLLLEKRVSKERQEVRNNLKGNARPLQSRASIQPGGKESVGKSARETANKFLDSVGIKD